MTGVIDAGYDFTLGGVQLYSFQNNLMPRISISDYFFGVISSIGLGDITKASFSGAVPEGYDWNATPDFAWIADPYCFFNLGDWINENTDLSLQTSGDYIETIDLFAEYNETK